MANKSPRQPHNEGLDDWPNAASDVIQPFVDSGSDLRQQQHQLQPDPDEAVVPDIFGSRLETSQAEIYSYYAYNVGNNGLASLIYAPVALQQLLARQAGEEGTLLFLGRARDVNSIVLMCNGASFALQTTLLLLIGGFADYSNFRSRILIFWSVVAFVVGFAWLGVQTPEKWSWAVALYVFGLTAFQLSVTYWTAAFPTLARNLPHVRAASAALAAGKISSKDYDAEDTKERTRISNDAMFAQSCGVVSIFGIIIVIIKASGFEESDAKASRSMSIIVSFLIGVWLVLALPWFLLEKIRPGADAPDGLGAVRAGLRKLKLAATNIWALKQSLVYLFCYFLLGDTLTTSFTLFSTLQYQIINYNPLTVTYLTMFAVVWQGAGIYAYTRLQKQRKLTTKFMVGMCIAAIISMTAWGMVGNWTRAFGFHNYWEIWVWQAFFGFCVCPWFSYGQIMISTLTPRGYESMFFSLFGVIGKTSSLFGPFLGSLIIDVSRGPNKDWSPFYALFALGLCGGIVFWLFLDESKSVAEQRGFLAARDDLGPSSSIELGHLLSSPPAADAEPA